MRYDEFRVGLQDALRENGLFLQHDGSPVETMDLAGASRRWETFVRKSGSPDAQPFYISAKVVFEWNPLNAARALTCEEDLLSELLGRKQRYPKTKQRWTRVDLALSATLPYGSTTPMPGSDVFGPWSSSVDDKLHQLFTEFKEREGKIVAITGGLREIAVEARSSPDGVLFLQGVDAAGFGIVRIPRLWDDPVRQEAEKDSDRELARLAKRFRDAIDEWDKSIVELARWIRFSPPPPETRPAEPWFDDDDEPEPIH